jgi:hypothetical protein
VPPPAECGCNCAQCVDALCIFCNRFPHGTEEEAERWFTEHPEVARAVTPLSDRGKAVLERALKKIEDKT